ncbi:DDE superfamily endonuclease [Kutzneria buriramensis]|uniref:DDE superfamily endonuclease n=1 Tax=Kutzneria buriramensis TaxID=1045776 RepID=A0A3E0GXM5_9PSEU|nr:DDE superfamily endonuclease [Kutzneria buriramensis]
MRAWLAANTERVELHVMPGYSPELNPDELFNADLKRNRPASRARTAEQLARDTRRFLRRRQRQPHLVRGYFRAPHVRYGIMYATE